jgi:hypothetical protein
METIALHKLGKISSHQICPRKRYWAYEHLETGIEPARMQWIAALELAIGAAIGAAIAGDEIHRAISEILAFAEKPGIEEITKSPDPGAAAIELGRLAGALALAWTLRRSHIIGRSRHQPATVIIGCSQNQPATNRPDSRVFDLLLEEETVQIEYFVTGHKWNGYRFMNPLLYFWQYDQQEAVTWQKPAKKATCYEPTVLEDWVHALDKGNIEPLDQDPIGTVILGGKDVGLEGNDLQYLRDKERVIKGNAAYVASESGNPASYQFNLKLSFPQYFHSCRVCDFDKICYGPVPYPKDATEEYPGVYKKRS